MRKLTMRQHMPKFRLSTYPAPILTRCTSTLMESAFPMSASVLGLSLSDTSSCAGGCREFHRPVCKARRCVAVRCSDAKAVCHKHSTAGRIARAVCPVTCGCVHITSTQLLLHPDEGCSARCSDIRSKQRKERACFDVPPGDAQLAAVAMRIAKSVSGQELDALDKNPRFAARHYFTDIAQSGCAAINHHHELLNTGDLLCNHPPTKPLPLFCPVSCNCTMARLLLVHCYSLGGNGTCTQAGDRCTTDGKASCDRLTQYAQGCPGTCWTSSSCAPISQLAC